MVLASAIALVATVGAGVPDEIRLRLPAVLSETGEVAAVDHLTVAYHRSVLGPDQEGA